MNKEKEYSFSTSHLVPLGFFLSANLLIELHPLEFPFVLKISPFILFAFSCMWDFKGLFFSTLLSSGLVLSFSPSIFQELAAFLFFIISFNTGLVTALFRKHFLDCKKEQEKEKTCLKAWETHYYLFRQKCLDELEDLKQTQEELMFADLEIQSLKQERLEEFLKEDESQSSLIKLLIASQEKCHHLEQEIELLEHLVSQPPPALEKIKMPRKKKTKEASEQAMLF